jgi:hypothetical protein
VKFAVVLALVFAAIPSGKSLAEVYPRGLASLIPPYSELQAEPSPEEWFFYESRLFGKNLVLMENLKFPGLRGIVSSEWNTLKEGESLSRTRVLDDICRRVSSSFKRMPAYRVLHFGVIESQASTYCRVAVADPGKRITDQFIYLSQKSGGEDPRLYMLHTFSFYYMPTLANEVQPMLRGWASIVKPREAK